MGRRRLVLAGTGVALGACAAPPRVPVLPAAPRVLEPVTLAVTLVAQPDINPDIRGRPSPIAVRVLELRSAAIFESGDFFALFERDEATLGSELLAHEQFILKPGESQSYARPANRDARHIAVLAGFRDLDRSVWRAIVPVAPPAELARAGAPAPHVQKIGILLSRMALRIEASPGS